MEWGGPGLTHVVINGNFVVLPGGGADGPAGQADGVVEQELHKPYLRDILSPARSPSSAGRVS